MNLSLKSKLTLMIILCLFVPFAILGPLWYWQSNRTIEENAAYYSRMLVDQTDSYINAYLSELERMAVPVLVNPSVQQFLHVEQEDYYDLFILQRRIRQELYANLVYGRSDIYGFTLIISESLRYSTRQDMMNHHRMDRYVQRLASARAEEDFVIEGLNRIDAIPVITAYKVFADPVNAANRGIMIIDLNLSKIRDILSSLKLDNVGTAYLLDAAGQYIYHPDRSRIGSLAGADELASIRAARGFRMTGSGADEAMVTYHTSALTGWTIAFEVPMHSLNADLQALRALTLSFSLLFAAGVLLLLGGYTLHLTRSLLRLQKLMKRAEMGDFDVEADQGRRDEIGALNRSFNHMVREYKRLIQVVHRSELRAKDMELGRTASMLQALQAQIHPHFLFNTLGTIHSYAIMAGMRPISKLVSNLSGLFRYSMHSGTQLVTLQEELRHARAYLDIQRERHEELAVEIRVAVGLDPHALPAVRLMLQPLLENALLHGYQQHGRSPDYVGLFVSRTAGGCAVRVADRGGGMTRQARERFNRLFGELTAAQLLRDDLPDLPQRIGLWNVHKRIRLLFGEPYGLWIEAAQGGGTVVTITIPDEHGGDDDAADYARGG
ncbi:histidine kinase [Paenibacillus sp. IB182496]|uniref:Histidine kinase n=1 Tax=Paenibacillus sabuli TaxID=2772509 RepID=A0A927BQD4_9BACL|nr:sensor histidine kinase [Paenibacillus sabuli]MBD2843830.1 histidine kinase [Paenibacillus sabuli]